VQIVVNSGNHRRHGRTPIDWVYVIDRFRDMYRESHRPEPARLLVAVVKAMQWSDPKLGPDNQLKGWRPDDTVDPRIMVSADWLPLFQPLKPDVRPGHHPDHADRVVGQKLEVSNGAVFHPGYNGTQLHTAKRNRRHIRRQCFGGRASV
jgi:hypothetical protein